MKVKKLLLLIVGASFMLGGPLLAADKGEAASLKAVQELIKARQADIKTSLNTLVNLSELLEKEKEVLKAKLTRDKINVMLAEVKKAFTKRGSKFNPKIYSDQLTKYVNEIANLLMKAYATKDHKAIKSLANGVLGQLKLLMTELQAQAEIKEKMKAAKQ